MRDMKAIKLLNIVFIIETHTHKVTESLSLFLVVYECSRGRRGSIKTMCMQTSKLMQLILLQNGQFPISYEKRSRTFAMVAIMTQQTVV